MLVAIPLVLLLAVVIWAMMLVSKVFHFFFAEPERMENSYANPDEDLWYRRWR